MAYLFRGEVIEGMHAVAIQKAVLYLRSRGIAVILTEEEKKALEAIVEDWKQEMEKALDVEIAEGFDGHDYERCK